MSLPEKNLSLVPSLVLPGVLILHGANPYWIGMTMIRIQEFYESKHDDIRGQVFSLEKILDRVARNDGSITYAADWMGFNVPGHVIDHFFSLYHGMLTAKEAHLKRLIDHNKTTAKYYLIGTPIQAGPAYSQHEYAHAAYYLDPEYQAEMDRLAGKLPLDVRTRVYEVLTQDGYADEVHLDELQAYLSTNSTSENREYYQMDPALADPFRKYHREYFRKRTKNAAS